MQAFVWNKRFETGIASVDAQHRHLVDIVNQMGMALIDGNTSKTGLTSVFNELAAYAEFHFSDEERLMWEAGLDPAHIESHRQHHQQFVEQLTQMWGRRAALSDSVEALQGFLASWLTFHILEEDQSMARQMVLVAQGVSAPQALAAQQQADNTSAILLDAMHNLYRLLAMQNKGLTEANEQLEEKVAIRSRELAKSEKMAAIGQLAASVAHDINNPIGFVNSNLGTLGLYTKQLFEVIDAFGVTAKEIPEFSSHFFRLTETADLGYVRDDLTALLQESQDGLNRVKRIVQSLLDLAHAEQDHLGPHC